MDCSLYIHIPFCAKKCAYCDFFSVPQRKGAKAPVPDERYVRALLRECSYYVRKYNITSWNTVYIGGGTPSLLGGELLFELLRGVRALADGECREITVEMNPEDVDERLLRYAEQGGATRISIGIQSLDPKALMSVGRGCSVQSVLSALDTLNKHWRGSLSVDLIAGLPGQTHKSFESQFPLIFSYNPDHISLYTLTVEENTPLFAQIHSGRIKWNADKADRMWIKGRNILEAAGFKQYEVSNFARPGFESLHNQVYWSLKSYIGIGSGASGTIYGDNALRWTNTRSIRKYEDFWLDGRTAGDEYSGIEQVREREIINLQTQEFEFIMMGFRMLKGVCAEDYALRFGESLEERIGADGGVFSQWRKRRLARYYAADGKTYYALTARGILFLNIFLESLM